MKAMHSVQRLFARFTGVCALCTGLLLQTHGQFIDISSTLGITATAPTSYNGTGLSFFDFNMDGYDDLTLGRGPFPIAFYENINGELYQVNFGIPNTDQKAVQMVLWADYDRDGDMDLLVTKDEGPVELWQNDGEFNFTNVAGEAGLPGGNYRYTGAAFCDYDHDGYLDLYIAKFYHPMLFSGSEYTGALFRNNGDGTFTDVTAEAGVYVDPRPIFQPIFFDYDNDGHEDLYLITDRTFSENALFKNNGDGTFTNVSEASGADVMICSMTGTVGDYNNDGNADVYITNNPPVGSKLLQNNGDGTFTDVAADLDVHLPTQLGWGSSWLDYDNDGFSDLFVSLTTNTPEVFAGNRLFKNIQGTAFTDVSASSGLTDEISQTYACAIGDLNNDGYYDLVLSNKEGFLPKMYLNSSGANNYLSISLKGITSNPSGIGSRIECYANGTMQVHLALCGENLIGQSANRYIFGLGDTETADSLVVLWNSGQRDTFYNLQANQHKTVTEGTAHLYDLEVESSGVGQYLCEGDSVMLSFPGFETCTWNTGQSGLEIYADAPGVYQAVGVTSFGYEITSPPFELTYAPAPDYSVNTTDETCVGLNDGSIQIEIDPSAVLGEINWGHDTAGSALESLAPGSYTFHLESAYQCAVSGEVEVLPATEILVVYQSSPVSCFGASDGAFQVTAFGGTPPYTQIWPSGGPDSLYAGSYLLIISDASGCTAEYDLEIATPEVLDIGAEVIPAAEDEGGSILLSVTGGTPPYNILWSDGAQGIAERYDLPPGMYEAIVTDANGCQAAAEFEIQETLSAEYTEEEALRLFPNPARNMLEVIGGEGNVHVRIFDASGKRVAEWPENMRSGSVAALRPGMYFLKINPHTPLTLRFVKTD